MSNASAEPADEADLDLSGYETAAGAAKALHTYLTEEHGARHAVLDSPEENPRGDRWAVVWEDGPHDWGVLLTLGQPMHSSGERVDPERTPEVVGFTGHTNWLAEPYYGFDVQFSDE